MAAVKWDAAGMKISRVYGAQLMKVDCLLQFGVEYLPQVEEFNYLEDLFTYERRMEREIDWQIGRLHIQ